MSLLRRLAVVSLVVILAGCQTLPVPAEGQPARRIGVISLMGDTFNGLTVGTLFKTREPVWSITDWQADQAMADQAAALLNTRPQWNAVALKRTAVPVTAMRKPLDPAVWAAAEAQGVQWILVFMPFVHDDLRGSIRPGFGLSESNFLGDQQRCITLAYRADVYEVASRSHLKSENSIPRYCRAHRKDNDLDLSLKDRVDEYSPGELGTLKQRLWHRMDLTLRHNLDDLGFMPGASQW